MPIYEYKCDDCGRKHEAIQKLSDAPLETCPSCQGKLQRLLSAPAIQFKGKGWYVTDYAKKSKDSGAQKSESDSPKTDKSKSAAPESKSKKDSPPKTKATG